MREPWLQLVATLGRPSCEPKSRERCLAAREAHRETEKRIATARAAAVARCEREIEAERAAVFAAGTGLVTRRMTELEREWRRLARRDPDAGMMELWARVAPARWIDRKRWRDTPADSRLDVALRLASDVDGVERAEAACSAFRAAAERCGTTIGPRVRWVPLTMDFAGTPALLDGILRVAKKKVLEADGGAVMLARAESLQRDVRDAALGRWTDRETLAETVAYVALVDCLARAASLVDEIKVITALCDLWKTGYLMADIDGDGMMLAIPE